MAETPRGTTPPVTWSIEYQRETTQPSPAGGFVTGVTVGFRTSHGVVQSVFVPYDHYTPDYVRGVIADRVAMIDAVHTLTG